MIKLYLQWESPWVEPGARGVVAERTIGDSLIPVTIIVINPVGILKKRRGGRQFCRHLSSQYQVLPHTPLN
jgi:hypothetical protein